MVWSVRWAKLHLPAGYSGTQHIIVISMRRAIDPTSSWKPQSNTGEIRFWQLGIKRRRATFAWLFIGSVGSKKKVAQKVRVKMLAIPEGYA